MGSWGCESREMMVRRKVGRGVKVDVWMGFGRGIVMRRALCLYIWRGI